MHLHHSKSMKTHIKKHQVKFKVTSNTCFNQNILPQMQWGSLFSQQPPGLLLKAEALYGQDQVPQLESCAHRNWARIREAYNNLKPNIKLSLQNKKTRSYNTPTRGDSSNAQEKQQKTLSLKMGMEYGSSAVETSHELVICKFSQLTRSSHVTCAPIQAPIFLNKDKNLHLTRSCEILTSRIGSHPNIYIYNREQILSYENFT